MRLSLASKITLLVQAVFLLTAVLIVLGIHSHIRTTLSSSSNEFYKRQVGYILRQLDQREEKLRSLSGTGDYRESFQNSVLEELRQIYYTDTDQESYPFIVNGEGSILLHPHLGRHNMSLQSLFAFEPDGAGNKGVVFLQENGVDFRVLYERFPPWNWTVCWAAPEQIADSGLQRLQTGMITILILAFIVMSLVLAYFITVLVRPVVELTTMANSIAEGNMAPSPLTDRRDEIGILARAFSRVQAVISEKIEQLNRSQDKYHQLVQHANSIILRWDRNGTVTYLNEYGQKLFGFTPVEIIGHHVVGTIVPETESTSGRDLAAMIDDIQLHPEAYALNENENIRKDGSRVWIQWSNNPILDEGGRFIEMLSVGINITERKRAEELLLESENRYRSLFETAGDAILIRNNQGVCIACNKKALELFGCSRKQLIGHTPDFIAPERQPDGELIQKALQGEAQTVEWQIKRLDGEIRDVQSTISSFEANGQQYIQSVLTDITRQKRMEVELRQAQKMEGIGTLAGGIAHDFNTILSAIIGYTELAQMKVGDGSELAKDLLQVRKASERARGLVRQILTFSRKQKHEDSVLQINLIVKEALKLIRSSIPTTIEIEQKITTRAGVRTDPTLIHQVIMNLCTNAYQAMLETGGKLTVAMHEIVLDSRKKKVEVDLPDGSYVNIEISDTGCGMDRKIMEKIFDPFFTTKEQDRGTGLGLAVVYDIVKGLNGGITVFSEPGRGATFSVFLPVAEEDGKIQGQPADPKLPTTENERIMVVDDEPAIRELMVAILSSSGYQVDLYENGGDAWLAFSEKPRNWSLIITDQTMPKLTGSQLAVQAMKIRPDIPVILCTGYSESISVEEAHEIGIRTYLHKPISLNELLASVHQALDKSS